MNFQRIVVLTGAGISAESGIRTFRSDDGLWENHRLEDVATPEAFQANPELVQAFYNARRQQLLSGAVRPNPAHEALARLEREFTGSFMLVTQNVDNLHERAGSQALIHMHGELLKSRCTGCGQLHPQQSDLDTATAAPCCGRPGGLRPHIVWFGEVPLEMDRIYQALSSCDLFVSIGTSGQVYPAAGFVREAALAGAHTLQLNLEPAGRDAFDEHRYGPASELVPAWVEEILSAQA